MKPDVRPLDSYLYEDWLDEISRLRPDELAPSLGSVVRALGEDAKGEPEYVYAKADIFLALTQLTPSYVEILKTILEVLRNRRYAGLFLNLDMGVGKTHLLALLTHLYVSCPERPQACVNHLGEYRGRSCYDDNIAWNTVVLAFDMRTPGYAPDYLRMTAKTLRRLGAAGAADLIEDAIKKGRMPDPQELASRIPDYVNVIVVVDELHHSLVYGDLEELEKVKGVLSFINSFLNYRRRYADERRSGLAVVVASARRDYERWNAVKSERDRNLVAVADGFVEQLERVETLVRSEWLSVDEAKAILARRLRLRGALFNEVFHRTFDKLIARILRADTDIPQAHHMRSLIKAMAVFALNALRSSDAVVTPARFSEEVVKALLPGHLGFSYLSVYNELEREVKNPDLMLAVNTVFALTITGDEMKLIELVRMAKEGRGPATHVPLATELEVREVLKAVRPELGDLDIDGIVRDLGNLHNGVHSIRLSDGSYAYFAIPVVNVAALYRSYIERRKRELFANRNALLEELFNHIERLYHKEGHVVVEAVGDVRELEKQPLDEDKLYIYVYLDRGSLKQLDPASLRVKDEVAKAMEERIKDFLSRRRALNVAIILPGVERDVLEDLALYEAVKEATVHVINDYLIPLEKGQLKENKVLYELMRLEQSEIESEVDRRLKEAVQSISRALARSLTTIYTYNRVTGGAEKGGLSLLQEVSWREQRAPREWTKVIDWMEGAVSRSVDDVRRALIKQVKGMLRFVDDLSQATQILEGYAEESLGSSGKAVIYMDVRVYEYGGSTVYIPGSVVREAVKSVKERLKSKHSNLKVYEDSQSVVLEVPREPPQPLGEPPVARDTTAVAATVPPARQDVLRSLYEDMERRGRGILVLRLRFTRNDIAALKTFIGLVRRYIAGWSVEEDRGSR